jgi:hypothetical protein
MSYTTIFEGSFYFDKPLIEDQIKYLKAFAEKRRCRIKTRVFENIPDPVREKIELPIGIEGEFCINFPQDLEDEDIIDSSIPPSNQPSLWCKWVPSDDGKELKWNGREKFTDMMIGLFIW